MKKSLIIICCILGISVSALAQELQKYSGHYDNGMPVPAEAIYTYYKAKNNVDKIKHGKFRYTVKSKSRDYKFNQSFTGMYHNNLKDKEWLYRLNIRDYFKNKQDYYVSGAISLTAHYKKGVPDGKWIFISELKRRKRISAGSKNDWDRYLPEEIIKITLNFRNGMLVDSVKIHTSYGDELDGFFDKNGMCDKKWIYIENGKKTIIEYSNGLKKSEKIISVSDSKTISNKVFSDDIDMHAEFIVQKTQDLPFELDTFSILRNKSNFMVSMIFNNIFNDKYFCYRYIPGDLMYYFESSKFKNKIKGAYELNFSNRITDSQLKKLAERNRLESKIINVRRNAQKFAKGKTLSKDSDSKLKIINQNASKVRMYTCYASFIVNEMDIKKGMERAKANCERKHFIKIKTPNFISKNEAVEYFIKTLKDMLVVSEQYYESISS